MQHIFWLQKLIIFPHFFLLTAIYTLLNLQLLRPKYVNIPLKKNTCNEIMFINKINGEFDAQIKVISSFLGSCYDD